MEKGRIGLNAGKVWHALNEVNEISTQELSRKLSLSIEDLALAIGWLAREKTIFISRERMVCCMSAMASNPICTIKRKQKKAIHHGQPISIVNLKSNTMKNTVQI
ncbi:winged helix-turn-helix domain-containing protein [Parabacteroides distasonis]|nr:winged helix-turn-helix domain-containing protein [Parabacteroides distasonis]